jgi:hypothetical protein
MIKTELDKKELVLWFFYNDKFLLLTHPKLAHSWCKRNINKDANLDTSYTLDYFTLDISKNKLHKTNDENHFSTTKSIWESFLQKKEKRDLIILYRNPFEHFISGFVQDFLKNSTSFNLSTKPFLHYFLDNIEITKKEKDNFLKDFNFSSGGMNPTNYEKYKNIWDKIIEIKFDYYINSGSLIEGHYSPWVTFINYLISSDKIDKNKIKLIDIYDAPLEEQLQNYLSDSNSLKRNLETYEQNKKINSHQKYFELIEKIINSNQFYKNIVYSLLKYEILYYNNFKIENSTHFTK